jgi:hypothetical protein
VKEMKRKVKEMREGEGNKGRAKEMKEGEGSEGWKEGMQEGSVEYRKRRKEGGRKDTHAYIYRYIVM